MLSSLSLTQPINMLDILLQTREWALSAFRTTRLAFPTAQSSSKHHRDDVVVGDPTLIGDDPLAASTGQVSPKAFLNRSERELKWHVQEIRPLKITPGKLTS